jgi:hypothetical protein
MNELAAAFTFFGNWPASGADWGREVHDARSDQFELTFNSMVR